MHGFIEELRFIWNSTDSVLLVYTKSLSITMLAKGTRSGNIENTTGFCFSSYLAGNNIGGAVLNSYTFGRTYTRIERLPFQWRKESKAKSREV